MRVIGTAGHVDHGKSTLVAALTGIHPDRLKEEQEREMTIDLGFGWMNLPDGELVGIVDVPGHRDFIENMLAGVGGIDAALFVVAADEGIMPQTREHLAILDLLQIPAGVIALTKIDLVENDPDWIEMIGEDVRKFVRGSRLADSAIVPVSAKTGRGLDDIRKNLQLCLAGQPVRQNLGRPRLPVDRVFTMAGFGTVVTGTLLDGQLRVGEEVEVLPAGLRGKIRGLQTHKQKEDTATQGSRTAVNISGIDVDQVKRGDVVTHPGRYQSTRLVDVSFRLLAGSSGPLRHSSEVKFFLGAAEIIARARVLGVEELLPGQEGWLQLELNEPVVAVRGDHYILRRPSPGETLGGGTVVDPHPQSRHKRFSNEVIHQLESLLEGSPADILFQSGLALGIAPLKDMITRARLSGEQAGHAVEDLLANGQLIVLGDRSAQPVTDGYAVVFPIWETETQRALNELRGYHTSFPLRRGMPREELKSRLKMTPRAFTAAVQAWRSSGRLEESATIICLVGHIVKFTPQQQAAVDRLLAKFAASPHEPPPVKECVLEVGEETFQALVETGSLVQLSAEVCFRRQDFDHMVELVRQHFASQDKLTVAQLRDQLGTSRRYVLAFLEHLDSIGITLREGDARRLRRSN